MSIAVVVTAKKRNDFYFYFLHCMDCGREQGGLLLIKEHIAATHLLSIPLAKDYEREQHILTIETRQTKIGHKPKESKIRISQLTNGRIQRQETHNKDV